MLRHGEQNRGHIVRLLSPLGRYPADSFRTKANALIISEDLCFSVVRITKGNWSEVDVLATSEIPLYGSVLLCGDAGTPHLYPYPSSYSVRHKTSKLESIDDRCIEDCKKFLLEAIQDSAATARCEPAASFHKPPSLGGIKYDLVPWSGNSNNDRLMILSRLEAASPLILRSINCLLKAQMAFQHGELREAGCLYLWIALDGAHSLILQRLRNSGVTNPTSADAARYFDQISGWKTEWEKFFEDDYDNRIRAFHPSNRVGDPEAVPQLLADDFFGLNDALIPLLHYLVEFP